MVPPPALITTLAPRIVAVHSYQGGTGKSLTAANLAVLLACRGMRVALVDTDLTTPGVHRHFGLRPAHLRYGLGDYLVGTCEIADAVRDVTSVLPASRRSGRAALYVVPAQAAGGANTVGCAQGYDVALLHAGVQQLARTHRLDVVVVDTHPGRNDETLLALAVADTRVLVTRPQLDDEEHTVPVVALRPSVIPRSVVLVNLVPPSVDAQEVLTAVRRVHGGDLVTLLPYSESLARARAGMPFVLTHPDHEITATYQRLLDMLGIVPVGAA